MGVAARQREYTILCRRVQDPIHESLGLNRIIGQGWGQAQGGEWSRAGFVQGKRLPMLGLKVKGDPLAAP